MRHGSDLICSSRFLLWGALLATLTALWALGTAAQAWEDTSDNPNPKPLLGQIGCEKPARYTWVSSGGDPGPYRRLNVRDGDNFYGERCELGLNDWRTGPTALFTEGRHMITYFSLRLTNSYPLADPRWQTVMQMKQSEPSDIAGDSPIIELNARAWQWRIYHTPFGGNPNGYWVAFPAEKRVWTRFRFDIYYSKQPAGWQQVSVDLNHDNDFVDAGGAESYPLRADPADGTGRFCGPPYGFRRA